MANHRSGKGPSRMMKTNYRKANKSTPSCTARDVRSYQAGVTSSPASTSTSYPTREDRICVDHNSSTRALDTGPKRAQGICTLVQRIEDSVDVLASSSPGRPLVVPDCSRSLVAVSCQADQCCPVAIVVPLHRRHGWHYVLMTIHHIV